MKRIAIVIAAVVFLVACALAIGITPGDLARIRAFDGAVSRWQSNPDFRAVTFEYVDLGSRAMQARICGIRAKSAIMAFRKIPGLPESLAVNPTSQSHYDDFSRGPWAAYFHLAGEQDVPLGIGLLEKLGSEPSDEQIRAMLAGFSMPVPIATDDGAVASVRSLLADIKADHPIPRSSNLRSAISESTMTEADRYSVDYQMTLLRILDQQLKKRDFELWRAKQVNDFLAGIWAQGYGQIYSSGIKAVLVARTVGIVVSITIASLFVLLFNLRRQQRGRLRDDATKGPKKDQSQPTA
jgi:hypothetical protein